MDPQARGTAFDKKDRSIAGDKAVPHVQLPRLGEQVVVLHEIRDRAVEADGVAGGVVEMTEQAVVGRADRPQAGPAQDPPICLESARMERRLGTEGRRPIHRQ